MTSAQKIWADQNGVAVNRVVFDALAQKQVIYTIDGVVKQVEEYQNNTLTFIEYYADDNENTADILDGFAATPVTVTIITQLWAGQYRVHTLCEYRDGLCVLDGTRRVYNTFNQMICEQDFDLLTNEPKPKSTEKYLYENHTDIRDDFALGFAYNSDGTLNYVWGPWVDRTYRARKGSVYADEMEVYFPGLLATQPYYADSRLT